MIGRVGASRRPLLLGDTEGPAGEAFRALRANVFATGATGVKSVVVAGSTLGEGGTTTAINLALVAAETGLRVLLIEADMRNPTAARYLNLRETPGLIAVLANRGSLTSAVQSLPGYGVDVIPAGGIPANPGELIGSTEMAALIETVVDDYDFVVIDAAAVLTATDVAVLARHTDGALLVVDTRRTKRRQLADATASLHRAGAAMLGVVLNKADLGTGLRSAAGLRRSRTPEISPTQPKVQLNSRPNPVASRAGAGGAASSSSSSTNAGTKGASGGNSTVTGGSNRGGTNSGGTNSSSGGSNGGGTNSGATNSSSGGSGSSTRQASDPRRGSGS